MIRTGFGISQGADCRRWAMIESAAAPRAADRRTPKDQMTRQAMADFQKAYELGVPKTAVRSDEDEVRRLFRAPRLQALARCPGWYFQSADGCLLLA